MWVICADDGGIIAYDRAGGLLESVTKLYAQAGVQKPPKPLHFLRHTFGTVMARRVPLGTLQKLMGHADVATTMRYVDVSEDDKGRRSPRSSEFLANRWLTRPAQPGRRRRFPSRNNSDPIGT